MKTRLHIMILSGILLTLLLGTLLAAPTTPDAQAQDGATPAPDTVLAAEPFKYDEPARVENGDAEWTINRSEFVNNYPDGFVFLGNAESSGGELVSASVLISYSPIWEDDQRVRGEYDAETGEIRVDVSGNEARGIPPWVAVNYRWRLSDASGTVYFSDWYVGEIYADNTRGWTRFENEDAIVFIQEGLPDNIAQVTLDAVEDTHDAFVAHFGRALSYVPRVMLFRDRATFEEWRDTRGSRDDSVIVGQTYQVYGAIVQFDLDGDPIGLANTVVHEVAHLYQYDIYRSRAPGWWTEGQATFFEFAQDYDYRQRVINNAQRDDLPPLFTDEDVLTVGFEGPDTFVIRWNYDVGYTFVKYLVDTYGNAALVEFHRILGEPEDLPFFESLDLFRTALETATGTSVAELERGWRLSLGASPIAPTLIPTPTLGFTFPPTPTPFGQ